MIFIEAIDIFTVFTSFRIELEVGVGREIEELGFSSTMFLIVSMFSSIILDRGGPGRLEGEMSPETINLLITLKKA